MEVRVDLDRPLVRGARKHRRADARRDAARCTRYEHVRLAFTDDVRLTRLHVATIRAESAKQSADSTEDAAADLAE